MTPAEITAVLARMPANGRVRATVAMQRAMTLWGQVRPTVSENGVKAAAIVALEVAIIAEGGLRIVGRVR